MQNFAEQFGTSIAAAVSPNTRTRASLGPSGHLQWLLQLLEAARSRIGKSEQAHGLRCKLEQVDVKAMGDTGFAREDATGIHTWQPDLPFFMQTGFDRHKI